MRADLRVLLPLLAAFGIVYTTTLNSYGMFMWDEAEYASIGRSVSRGEGFSIGGVPNPLRPPVLPLAVAATIAMTGSTEDAVVRRPALAFSLLALAVTFWIGAAAYDRLTGLVAAVLLAVCPPFWTATPLLLTEIPFMAFFAAAIACFVFGLYRDARYFYWSWGWWGLALLTRYTAVLFAPIAALFVVAAYAAGDPAVRSRLFSRQMLLAPGIGFFVTAPWLLRQQLTFGDALAGMRQASTQLQLFMPGVSMPWFFYIVQMPAWLSPAVAVLLVTGAIWIASARDRFGLHCLGAVAVIFVWMSAYRFKEARQVASTLPLIAIVAAAGARHAVLAAARPRRAVAAAVVLLMALAGVEYLATRGTFQGRVTLGYPSFLPAMRFLREHSSPAAVIVGANVPQIHWYADRRVIGVPLEAGLRDALARSEWMVLTNFERGQPPYAGDLMRRLLAAHLPDDDAAIFRDPQFRTLVVRSSAVRQHEQ